MEPDIAPLAKRLAEENNVNWRQLSGSGPSGRVVERDVLEYLARVMAGEEAIDPTPEPFPEGMAQWPGEALWPGQDVPRPQPADSFNGFNDFDDARFAEPETGLARDVTPYAEAPVVKEPSSFIDESILLLDDEGAVPEVWEAEPTLVLEEEPGAAEDSSQAFDEPDGFNVSVLAAKDEDDWRALVKRDERWPEPAGGIIEVEAEPAVVEVEPVVPRAWGEDDWRSFADRDEDDAVWSEAEVLELDAVADNAVTDDVQVVPVAWAADDQLSFTERGEPEPDGEMLTRADEAMAPVVAKPVLPEAFASAFSEDASVAPAIPGALPLVSYGVMLRRHINLTALAEAQRAAGRELSDGTPIPPSAFLLRAAAKALRREPLGPERSVALAVLSKRGLGARRLDKAELLSFSQLVAMVNEARASETTELEPAALLVADLSEYALDEAVLRVDVPVLTLGRILYDSQEGSYHSTLSLSGEFVAAVGAKLLGEVASLLDSPVQLVL